MAVSQGFNSKLGVGKESVFGIGVEVTDLVPFTSESLTFEYNRIENVVLKGSAGKYSDDIGSKVVQGNIECDLLYGGSDCTTGILRGIAFGSVVHPFNDNIYKLSDNPTTSCTIAIDKGVSVWQFLGCMVNTYTLKCDDNGAKESFGLLCYDVDFSEVPNNSSVLSGLSYSGTKVLRNHLDYFKIGDLTGDLGLVDQEQISGFELTINNNLNRDWINGTRLPNQSLRNGFREVSFKFTVPRYDTDIYIDWKDAGTKLQAYMSFGDEANALNQIEIYIPTLKIINCNPTISGAGIPTMEVECKCFLRDQVNNTYMTTDTNECWLVEYNKAIPYT